MNSALYTLLTALGVAGIGAAVGLLTVRAINRKTNVESDSVIVSAAEKVVHLLREEMGHQSNEIRELKEGLVNKDRQIHLLKVHVEALEREVRKLGGNPPPLPGIEGV